jgi:flagellar biosynthesis GTPase FlhF
MIVKTFTGTSVRETLQMVRDAFGADAVILDTRVEESGAQRLGLPRGGIVITAAVEPQRPQVSGAEGPRSLHLKGTLGQNQAPESAAPAEAEAPEIPAPSAQSPAEPIQDRFAPVLRELQRVTDDLLAAKDETLWEVMRAWLSGQPSLSSGIFETFATFLVEALPPHQPFLSASPKGQTVLVVGARGVGKSTFLFKALAARWQAIQRKPSLTVLSGAPDHGHERLQALSIGCGVEFSTHSLGQSRRLRIEPAASQDAFAEYIIGRVSGDLEAHAKLIRRTLKPDAVALVLNATSPPRIWRQQLNGLAVFAPTHLVFTHWDESQSWWDAVTFSGQSRLPLAYRVSGFDAFGEIDPFSATDILAGITDHVTRAIGSPGGGVARKEDA